MRHLVVTGLVLVAAVTPAAAQTGVALSGRVGTLGLGAEASIGLGDRVGLRGGVAVQPWEPSRTFDDIEFTLDLASPSWQALIDLYPLGSGFRLSGGLVGFGSEHEVRGEPTEAVDIGGQTYTPDQIGVLSGEFRTKKTAPYAGIGFGRLGGRRGAGLVVDLGVAFQGEPDVVLDASGPIAALPTFQQNLAEEEAEIEDDAALFRFYPVLTVGFVIGF